LAGTYADDRRGGVGDRLANIHPRRRRPPGRDRVRLGGASLQQAIDDTLADIREMGGTGGLIAVAPSGEAAWGFTTSGMYRGAAGPDERQVAVYGDER
jgi:beta-aspartyl-peptidase (threonine type)